MAHDVTAPVVLSRPKTVGPRKPFGTIIDIRGSFHLLFAEDGDACEFRECQLDWPIEALKGSSERDSGS